MVRKLAAILAADVVGYSRLVGLDEAGTLAAVKSCRTELIEPSATRHGGHIVKLMGDGILAEFPSAAAAVECANDIQAGMERRGTDIADDRRLLLRIGVNLGDIVFEDGDIFGDGVNIAARLEARADPGGILMSGAVYDQVRNKLDLAFESVGELDLKNIAEPIRAYKVAADSSVASTTPSVKSSDEPLLPDRPSVAVLPFANMSGDADQEYFSDGITEDIITELSRFRDLFVIARNSSFTYKGRAVNVRQVGRELGVHYILEGSVRRAGDRIRVTAQLVDAETGHHIWAERYDRQLEDIFAVQDELTETIAATLERQVGTAAQQRAARKSPQNMRAYDFILRGQAIIALSYQDNLRARELYEKALRLEPDSARAWVSLANTHMLDFTSGWGESPRDSLDEALKHARKAAQLDSADSFPQRLLGNMCAMKGQPDEALSYVQRALRLNPNDAHAHASLAQLHTYLGKHDVAIDEIATAMRLNPHHPSWYLWHQGFALVMAGDSEAAVKSLKEALSKYSGFVTPHRHLAVCYMRLGRENEANDEVAEIIKLDPAYNLKRLAERLPFKDPAQRDGYLDDLRHAGVPEE
ncbi:MAG: adenylate/guanylate cyclase domain-containing protein [Proteobacteria bacterium]|nr:adenylate/guanylate cyclase domain-containing protein [Pseudomonadota bacterium]